MALAGRRAAPRRGARPGRYFAAAVCCLSVAQAVAGTVVVEVRVAASSDDADQAGATVFLANTDLALGQRIVGLRFANLAVPPGAPITNAYVEFVAAADDNQSTDVTIEGEASDDAGTFVAQDSDISNRPRTTASVAWTGIGIWTNGNPAATPDLTAIIQEIVDRPGWASGNALVLVLTGTGRRRAVAYDGVPASAALLHVEYASPGVTLTESGGSTDVSEAGPTSDDYTVVLDTQPAADVVITVDPDQQTDVGAGAGSAITLTFTSANWSVAQTVTVTAVDDDIAEGAHTSTITHTASSGDADYDAVAIADITANVTDNDTAAVTITESGGSTDVDEAGPTSDSYLISLESQPTADVDVIVDPDVQTDVGAGAGAPVLLTFTSSNWDSPQTVTVTAVDDQLVEGTHSSTITHSPSSADANYDGIAVANVVATITDNDAAGVAIVESGGSTWVEENGPTSDTYTVVLDSEPTASVTVTAQPDVQTDLGAGPGVAVALVYTTVNWDTPQTVTVTAVDDAVAEGTHTSTITHSASSTDSDYNGVAIADVVATVIDNDTAGVTISETDGSTDVAEEGPTSDTYTVMLDMQPTADVVITVDPDNQTDLGAGAGAPVALTFRVSNWQFPRVVTVTAVDDAIIEGAHTSTITHTASSSDPNYNGITIPDVVANVTDNDVAGITITESDNSTDVNEQGPTSDTYTLVLDKGPAADVIITVDPDVQTDLGAGPGNAIFKTFTSANWNSPQTVTVTAVDDAVAEGGHTSTITHSVSSGDPLYDGLVIPDVTANITDNDNAAVIVTESGGSTDVSEAGPTADTYTVVLESQPTASVTIAVDPDVQTDLGAGPGTAINLTFTTGNWETPQTVTVTAVDDAIAEGGHTSTITHAASSSDPLYDGAAIGDVIANITDNDTAGVTITETGGSTDVDETGPTSDTYTIVLDTEPTANVSITVTPDIETDLGAGPGTAINVTLTPGDWSTPHTVVVTAVDDSDPEGYHTSTITHVAASSDANYDAIAISDVIANVTDNDLPGVTIAESGGSTDVSEAGPTSDSYNVVLDSAPSADVTITVTPDAQTDLGSGAATPITLTFTPTDWSVAQIVTVTAVDDAVFEGPHNSTITHAAASTDSNYDAIAIPDVVANVTDDDWPGATVSESGGSTDVAEEGPTSDTYTVVLDSQPTADVTVTVDPDTQTDVGAGAGSPIALTFTAGDWDTPQTVTVTAVDDAVPEGDHTSTITHASSSTDANYDGLAILDVVASVTDNDVPGVTIAESGGSTDVDEAGPTSDTYTVVLGSQPAADVTITVDPDVQTDVGAGAGSPINLTFTAGNWSTPQTVTVTAVDDAVAEGAHTSTITHVAGSADSDYDGIAIPDVTANVTDNDTAGITVTESGGSTDVDEAGPTSDTYTLVLDSQPEADVTVTVDPDGQTDLGAGAGVAIVLTFTAGNWSTPQVVTVTAVDDMVAEGTHTSTITHTVASGDTNYGGMAVADVTATVTDNDTAGVTITETGGSTDVSEEGPTSDTYTIVLDSQPIANVDVTVDPDAQTDLGAGPGVALALTFTAANWNAAQTITVTAVDDLVAEGPHTSTITHTASSTDGNYDAIAIPDVVANITDNDTAGVTITESGGSTDVSEEGPASDTYTIVLDSQPLATVTIAVDPDQQVDLGAGAGVAINLTFTVANWDSPQTVLVTAVDDALVEGPHNSTITHSPSSADGDYDGLSVPDVIVNIADNDTAGATITESGGSTDVSEAGPTSDTYTIVLDAEPTADATITVDPDQQTDLGAGGGAAITLTFTPTNWSVPQTVTVTAVDDLIAEGNHTSTITHTVSSADAFFDGVAVADVVANVADNDAPGITLTESGGSTAVDEQGPTADTYTIVLDSEPTDPVNISADPDAQTDLGAGPGAAIVLVFTAANWQIPQTITVLAVDDDVAEGSHASTITHGVSTADGVYAAMTVPDVVASVADNDAPGIIVAESAGSTAVSEEGPTADTYTLVLNSEPTAQVTVTATPDVQTDLGAGAGVPIALSFAVADWNEPYSVTVTAVDDGLVEGTHDSTITHTASSTDDNYRGAAIADVTVQIADNDTAGVTVVESGSSTLVSEAGPTSDTYTIVLESEPSADVTITAAPSPALDLGAGPGEPVELVFTPTSWHVPRTVVVTAVDDDVIEGTHSASIAHSAAGGDADYAGMPVASVSVTVLDNDDEPDAAGAADTGSQAGSSPAEEPGDAAPGEDEATIGDEEEPDDTTPPKEDMIVEEVTTTVFVPGLCGPMGLPVFAMCFAGLVGLKRLGGRAGRRPDGPPGAAPRHVVRGSAGETHELRPGRARR